MKYRQFGSTGKQISELVFGCGAIGGLIINADDKTRRQAVRLALDEGINWFDTAPSYGQGKSETALGWLLSEVEESPYVSTKFSVDTLSLETVAAQVEQSLTSSLQRLQRTSVTLLQLHNPIGEHTDGRTIGADDVLRSGGILDVLEGLRDRGLIEHFGVTALGDPGAIRRVIESGRIDSAQIYFNVLNPSAAFAVPSSWPVYDFEQLLVSCSAHGVATMNIRVLSAGVIATDARTGRERPLTPGDTVSSEAAKAARLFAAIGERFGTRAQTAIRFALAEPSLSCVIVGLAEVEHLEEALAAAKLSGLSTSEIDLIKQVYSG